MQVEYGSRKDSNLEIKKVMGNQIKCTTLSFCLMQILIPRKKHAKVSWTEPRTTDTRWLNPYSLRPKFRSQSQVNILYVDIKA